MPTKILVVTMALGATVASLTAVEPSATTFQSQGRLAFALTRGETDAVALRDLAGGPLTLVSLPPAGGRKLSVYSLKWSPQARKLAISDSRGRVFVVGDDGGGLRQIAVFPERSVAVEDWSPDGRDLAVEANGPFAENGDCPTGEPGIYIVAVNSGQIRRIAAHPRTAPPISKRPAIIDLIAWAPEGSRLLYDWTHFQKGDCRIQNSQTVVTAIRTNGAEARQVAALDWPVNSASWSPDHKLLAMTTACEDAVPIAWANNSSLVIVTTFDGCRLQILDNRWQTRQNVELYPSEAFGNKPGTVLYSVNARTGKVKTRRAIERGGDPFSGIGTLKDGSGTVAVQWNPSKLFLVTADGNAPRLLTPAAPPAGMTLGTAAAAR